MTKYSVNVIDQEVSLWTDEGEGDYVCSKGGFHIGTYPTLEAAKQAIDDFFGYELDKGDYQEDYISASLIEDGEGYIDPDGGYIVHYIIGIDKIEPVYFGQAA